MSERAVPRPEVQSAFAEAAGELQLAMTPQAVEARCVGVAFAMFQPTIDAELADPTAAPAAAPDVARTAEVAATDEAAAGPEADVRAHLQRWESLPPDEFAASWRQLATEPYVGVGPGWVGTIDQATVEQWMASADLREALETHPPFSPRQVTIENLQLVWLGPARVVATYRAEETYRNGAVAAGNTFAVLLHVKDRGWLIAVASKGTRHEAPLRA